MNDWTVTHHDGASTDKADNGALKMTTVLRYLGKEMARGSGMMQRCSLTALCADYNNRSYVPPAVKTCIADLPKAEREAAIKKMADGVQEGLPFILSPDENFRAKQAWKGGR